MMVVPNVLNVVFLWFILLQNRSYLSSLVSLPALPSPAQTAPTYIPLSARKKKTKGKQINTPAKYKSLLSKNKRLMVAFFSQFKCMDFMTYWVLMEYSHLLLFLILGTLHLSLLTGKICYHFIT